MTCPSTETRLLAYLDGDLSPDLRNEVEEHLAGCAKCRELFDTAGETAGALREAPMLEPPDIGWSRLTERMAAGKAPWLKFAAAAAILVVLAGIGILALDRDAPLVRNLEIEVVDAKDHVEAAEAEEILDSHAATSPVGTESPYSMVEGMEVERPK